MNGLSFATQLKSFCINVRSDCDKLKKSISEAKSSRHAQSTQDTEKFIATLEAQLESIQSSILSSEVLMFGPAECRLSFVRVDEVGMHLFRYAFEMIFVSLMRSC